MTIRPAPSYSGGTLPRFVAVEGPDGSGTSTQTRLLAEALRHRGIGCHVSLEPTGGPVGQLIKRILRGEEPGCIGFRETERLLAHLFAADRQYHLYHRDEGLAKLTSEGNVVLSTRYFFSSYAYNARTEEQFELIDRLNRDFPLPEAVVYLSCPVEELLRRLNSRPHLELYEKREELSRVMEAYDRILEPIAGRVVRADSSLPRGEVHEQVLAGVLKLLGVEQA